MLSSYVFKYLNESDVKHLQKQVQFKLNRRKSLDTQASPTMVETEEKPPDVKEISPCPSPKDIPSSTPIDIQISPAQKATTNGTPQKAANVHKVDVPVKPFKNIEAVLSTKDLELDLASLQIAKVNTDEKNARNQQMRENVLTRITTSQRAICACIDLIIPSMMLEKYYDSRSEFERDLDRFAAFSRVFTRNHLYRIELLMSEIQVTTPPPPPSTLFNKISLLFDMLHMALAYYIRSVKTFPKHIAFEKTMRLVYFVGDTVRLCVERNFFDGDDFVIQTLMRKIDDTCTQMEGLRKCRVSSKHSIPLKSNNTPHKTHTLDMYGPSNNTPHKTHTLAMYGPSNNGARKCRTTNPHIGTHIRYQATASNGIRCVGRSRRMASPTLSRSSSMPPLAPQRRRAASANRISIASMPSMDLSGRRRTIKSNDNSHIHTVPSSSSSSHSPSIPNSTNRSVRRDEMIHENIVERAIFTDRNIKYALIVSNTEIVETAETADMVEVPTVEDKESAIPANGENTEFPNHVLGNWREQTTPPNGSQFLRDNQVWADDKWNQTLLTRISDEIGMLSPALVHKHIDMGEEAFVDRFLALEML